MDKEIFEDMLELKLTELKKQLNSVRDFMEKGGNYSPKGCPLGDYHDILQAVYWYETDWVTCPLCKEQIYF